MPQLHDTPYAWARLGLTLAIACICSVGMWAVIVVLPSMQAEFGLARADASLPYVVTMIGFATGSMAIGRWVDRRGVTSALWLSAILQAGGFVLAALAPGAVLATICHLVIGFGAAGGFAPLIADISHWFLKRRGIAVSLIASGNYLAGAIWPLLLSGVQVEFGWRGAYTTLAVIIVMTVLPMSLALRRRIDAAASDVADRAAASRAQGTGLSQGMLLALLVLAGVSCCVAMSMPQVHIVALCTDLGFGQQAGAQMLSLMLLGGVISRIACGMLADKLGGLRTILISSALQCAALILYLPASGLTSLYLVSAIFGLAQGGIVPSYSLVVREFMPARVAGTRVGLVVTGTILGMALGGWLSGWLYDMTGSYTAAFLNGIGWNLLNLLVIGAILWTTLGGRQTAKAA